MTNYQIGRVFIGAFDRRTQRSRLLPNFAGIIQFLDMNGILQFNISREDGAYTADCVNAPIVTFGHSFEDLQQNIREAVALFFEGEDANALGFVASPSILTSFELPALAYGNKA